MLYVLGVPCLCPVIYSSSPPLCRYSVISPTDTSGTYSRNGADLMRLGVSSNLLFIAISAKLLPPVSLYSAVSDFARDISLLNKSNIPIPRSGIKLYSCPFRRISTAFRTSSSLIKIGFASVLALARHSSFSGGSPFNSRLRLTVSYALNSASASFFIGRSCRSAINSSYIMISTALASKPRILENVDKAMQ